MDYAQVINEVFGQIEGVRFGIRLWDGRKLEYGKGRKKAFTLLFHEEKAAKRLLSQGSLGFGESYMDGSLQIEGSLDEYLKLRHQFKKVKPSVRLATAKLMASRDTPKDTKGRIAYHYDFSNEFFKLILDKRTMSYSSGIYVNGQENLGQAQQNKIKLVCEWIDAPSGAKILDLGCGWGGFATYAATNYDWTITSCTLSVEQLKFCKDLVRKKSLQKKILLEYRDMLTDLPDGEFDAIVMLESIEHVGKSRLNAFIKKLYQKLKPGGVLYIQASGRYKPKALDRWTLKYVFPGGYLPSQQELVDSASGSGFKLKRFVDDAPNYALTIDSWIKNLETNRHTIEKDFGVETYRLWELWMHGARIGFEVGSMGLFRMKLQRPEKL